MINDKEVNIELDQYTQKITQWHHDRNLINGVDSLSQTGKLLEEFTELVAAQMPGATPKEIGEQIVYMINDLYKKNRIKSVKKEDSQDAFRDALGDMYVVQVNLAERDGVPMAECVKKAYDEIKDRKGKVVDGVFVKEEDIVDSKNVIPISATHRDSEGSFYRQGDKFWCKYVSGGWHVISGEPTLPIKPVIWGSD